MSYMVVSINYEVYLVVSKIKVTKMIKLTDCKYFKILCRSSELFTFIKYNIFL